MQFSQTSSNESLMWCWQIRSPFVSSDSNGYKSGTLSAGVGSARFIAKKENVSTCQSVFVTYMILCLCFVVLWCCMSPSSMSNRNIPLQFFFHNKLSVFTIIQTPQICIKIIASAIIGSKVSLSQSHSVTHDHFRAFWWLFQDQHNNLLIYYIYIQFYVDLGETYSQGCFVNTL